MDPESETPTLLERRDILARSTVAYTTLALLACYLIGSPGLWATNFLHRVVAILAAATVMFAAAAMVSRLPKFGLRKPVTALGMLLAAQAYIWTLGGSYILLEIDPEPGWFVLVPQGTVLAGTFLYLAARHAHAVRVHRDRIRELERSSASLDFEREHLVAQRESWHRAAEARILATIDSVLHDVRCLQAPDLVERLRQVAHDVVRPMSHEMAAPRTLVPGLAQPVRTTTSSGIVSLLSTGRINPWAFTAIAFLLALVLGTTVYSWMSGLEFAVVVAAGACVGGFLAMASSRVLTTQSSVVQLTVRLILLSAIGLASLTLAVLFAGESPFSHIPPLAWPIYAAIGLSVAVIIGASDARAAIERDLDAVVMQRRWALARQNEEHYSERRQLARIVHGPLQAALNAAAIRLDLDIRAGRDIEDTRQRIVADISRTSESLSAPRQIDVAAALREVTSTWDGSCDVLITMTPECVHRIEGDPVAAAAIVDVVTEATTNAVRHGSASRILIDIVDDDDSVIVTATNNGHVLPAEHVPGLGTEVLEHVSIRWKRKSTPQGVELTAVLPLAAPE